MMRLSIASSLLLLVLSLLTWKQPPSCLAAPDHHDVVAADEERIVADDHEMLAQVGCITTMADDSQKWWSYSNIIRFVSISHNNLRSRRAQKNRLVVCAVVLLLPSAGRDLHQQYPLLLHLRNLLLPCPHHNLLRGCPTTSPRGCTATCSRACTTTCSRARTTTRSPTTRPSGASRATLVKHGSCPTLYKLNWADISIPIFQSGLYRDRQPLCFRWALGFPHRRLLHAHYLLSGWW